MLSGDYILAWIMNVPLNLHSSQISTKLFIEEYE